MSEGLGSDETLNMCDFCGWEDTSDWVASVPAQSSTPADIPASEPGVVCGFCFRSHEYVRWSYRPAGDFAAARDAAMFANILRAVALGRTVSGPRS